jgi:hypothetical protein
MEHETKSTYRVPDENLWKLNRNIAKLNKSADKLHLQPVVVTETGIEEVEIIEDGERKKVKNVWQIISDKPKSNLTQTDINAMWERLNQIERNNQ